MKQHVRLDVSMKETHICVVDGDGRVLGRGREVTQPELLAAAIVDARRAKAVPSCRLNKTDANDAEGLAQLAREQRQDLENQVRGLLRKFGDSLLFVAETR
jgi:hypothetical protein